MSKKSSQTGLQTFGLLQCINEPTHKKGNTLDILLTKSFSYIKDLKIIDTERYCISDHCAITFVITETVKRKPRVKRKCYNYKNANWDILNEQLAMIDWDILLDYSDPETAWANFKEILFSKIDDHIPKFTIKTEYHPLGLIPSATLNAKKKTNCIKILSIKKP